MYTVVDVWGPRNIGDNGLTVEALSIFNVLKMTAQISNPKWQEDNLDSHSSRCPQPCVIGHGLTVCVQPGFRIIVFRQYSGAGQV